MDGKEKSDVENNEMEKAHGRKRMASETLARLTWSFSDVRVRRVLPLIGDRVGNVGQRQFALVELVEPGQLVELVPGLLLEKVLVVEVRPGQDTCADRRWILRSVSFRVRHHRHRVCKLVRVSFFFFSFLFLRGKEETLLVVENKRLDKKGKGEERRARLVRSVRR